MNEELKTLLGDLNLMDAIALHEASEEQDVADEMERKSEQRQSAFVLRVIRLLEKEVGLPISASAP